MACPVLLLGESSLSFSIVAIEQIQNLDPVHEAVNSAEDKFKDHKPKDVKTLEIVECAPFIFASNKMLMGR
jgi:hypothetical protein